METPTLCLQREPCPKGEVSITHSHQVPSGCRSTAGAPCETRWKSTGRDEAFRLEVHEFIREAGQEQK